MSFCKKLSLFILIIPFLGTQVAFADTSNIASFVFTTSEQSVKSNEISKEIIVQTQNGGGVAEKVSETNDVTFSSTSDTGEFLNSSGGPVTTTMSKNTSSRTFYYRDSKSGTFVITITIKGRETGEIFSASQNITVGSSSSSAKQTESVSTNKSSTSNDDALNSDFSSHSSQSNLTSVKSTSSFKVDAGRKRIVSINTPVDFSAIVSGIPKESKKEKYEWSFGDGTGTRGKTAVHTYGYEGDYVIVLNGTSGDERATSRTEIRVVDYAVSIEEVVEGENGYVALKNQGENEANIGSWILFLDPVKKVIIAPDTIIKPGATIRVPFPLSFDGKNVALYFPNGSIAFSGGQTGTNNQFSISKFPESEIQIIKEERTNMLREIVELQTEIENREGILSVDNESTEVIFTESPGKSLPVVIPSENVSASSSKTNLEQTSSLLNAFEEGEKQSVSVKIKNFIKSIFSP